MTSLPTVVLVESEAIVLVVWDDEGGLELIKRILSSHGFHVITARRGEEAVKIYQDQQEEIDIVLLNRSPDGPATFEALLVINPAIRCAFMSASGPEWHAEMMSRGAVGCIQKPFRIEELVRSMQEWSLR